MNLENGDVLPFHAVEHPPVLVIGLGNPILGDDGVGWQVARQVQERLEALGQLRGVEIDCLALGGLGLMERMVGYRSVILVDAILTGERPLGSVSSFPLEALPARASGHMTSAHDTSLQTALAMGRQMGAQLPQRIHIVAIEAQSVYDFSEEFTPPVANAVPQAVHIVLKLVRQLEAES